MRSPVNWALLGLIIERPSYGYELAHRFERAYGGMLRLSSSSHVYTALDTLEGHGLIEEILGTGGGRQPKPHYRATAKGVRGYREWLIAQVRQERGRSRLFVRQLAVFAQEPDAALEVIEHYSQVCLAEAGNTPLAARPAVDASTGLIDRLTSEASRTEVEAKLTWIDYARREFRSLAKSRVFGR
ncbi:MAG TPA: PadR family transcriptional regulator [Solirubrobacteraceae bacterium]|jgi:DNA-binding PadR family transcriptional regulator